MWVKKGNPQGNPQKSRDKKKWGCQIGKNGGQTKKFPTKNVAKKKGLLIDKHLESQIGKNYGSGGKKKYGEKSG